MAIVTVGSRKELSPALLSSIHDFRRDVFVRRLGWSLPLIEGEERDQFDCEDTVYITVCDSERRITACSRLLPTTSAYMLPSVFPNLLGGSPAPNHAAIWELSRFATSVRATGEGRVLSLSQPTLELLDLVFDYSRRRKIERLILVSTIAIERLMLRAGLEAHRIGPPALTNGALCVALFIEVPERRIEKAVH